MSDVSPELPAEALQELALFPLPNVVLFPGALLPLHVFEPRYRQMVTDLLAGSRALGVVRLKPGFEPDYYGRPPIFEVCGAGVIEKHEALDDGKYNLMVRGVARVRIAEELPTTSAYRVARCERLQDSSHTDARAFAAWQSELERSWNRLAPYLPSKLRGLGQKGDTDSARWVDRIAAAVVADPAARQALLEELDPAERLGRLLQLLQELGAALNADTAPSPRELN